VTSGPNLLLITTDQQRFDTIGHEAVRTPHLDQLRYQGVQFTRAYAQTPICVPARVSIMTGRGPFHHGMTHNGPSSAVMGRDGTLPALLREQGYGTAAIGKLHFTPQRARHGFDETVLPDDYYRAMAGQPQQPMRHGLGQNELYPGLATVPEAQTLTAWIADQCVQYIRDRRDPTVPFFLWASFSKPHPPLDPPEPYASMYSDQSIPEPVCGQWAVDDHTCPPAFARQRQRGSFDLLPPPVVRAARAAYYGLVTQVDYAIGRIFAGLQDIGLFDDTLILFTSDHGEFLGDHRCGNKVMFHEPSARIPFLLRPPAGWSPPWHGRVSEALVTHADVLPTLVAAAGGAAPPDATGLDLMALLRGETAARDHLCGVATEAESEEPLYLAITDDRWKYCWYPEGAREQLFDLSTDPWELVDLSGDRPAVAGSLRDTLVRDLRALGSPWVTGDRLVSVPPRGDSVADRRASGWPGYHTEHHPADVRH
jgi:arylsulfatase